MRANRKALVVIGTVLSLGSAAFAQSSSPFSGLFGGKTEESPVSLDFRISGADEEMEEDLRSSSLMVAALNEKRSSGQDLLAAARSDYARLLGTLYDQGYYSSVINITLDGVEAAEIAPLDAPETVSTVLVTVEPGSQFSFSRAEVGPLAPETRISDDYRAGEPGGAGVIKSAALTAVDGWRNYGHAKADVGSQEIIADHNNNTVDSRIGIDSGPMVRFGRLDISGYDRMNPRRLYKIAGFPEGERFDPEKLDRVRERLRRSGVFSATTLDEAETLGPGNTLDVNLTVVEQKPRRIGAGFELSNTDGAKVSAYWMHRNLLGGGERFRAEAEGSDIGSDTSGRDHKLTLRLDRPATITADTTAYILTELERKQEEDYDSDDADIAFGLNHIYSNSLTGDIALKYETSRIVDSNGKTRFRVVSMPATITWDKRDEPNNAKRGYYLKGEAAPFKGLVDTGSGVRVLGEGRGYYSLGDGDRFTLAGRARLGTILGSEIAITPRDYLFYSGGGGSVRGQPYESLGAEVIPGPDGLIKTGGMSLANVNAELRWQVREKISLAAFADYGRIWAEDGFAGDASWHSGAGVGIRYDTPIGPLRFDVAGPTGGDTDSGIQLYLGLGQAF